MNVAHERRGVGDVKSRECRKSKRYTQVTPSWPMLEQKGLILVLLVLLLHFYYYYHYYCYCYYYY